VKCSISLARVPPNLNYLSRTTDLGGNVNNSTAESIDDVPANSHPRSHTHKRTHTSSPASRSDIDAKEFSESETDSTSTSEPLLSDGSGSDTEDHRDLNCDEVEPLDRGGPPANPDGNTRESAPAEVSITSEIPTTTLQRSKCSRNQEIDTEPDLDNPEDMQCAESDCEDNTSMENMVTCDGPGCKLRVRL
jgi:hypothetical protein